MKRSWIAVVAVLCSACGSGDERPAGPNVGSVAGGANGGTDNPGAAGLVTRGGGANGGSKADGGAGTGVGGDVEVPGGGVPSFPDPVCDPGAAFDANEEVEVADEGELTLLAITPDELSVAFTLSAGVAGDEGSLWVADRESADVAFPTGRATAVAEGFVFTDGAALSANGLKLVLTREDRRGFGELSRESRGEGFGPGLDETRFQHVNLEASMGGADYGFPLLSHDQESLYFVRTLDVSLVMFSTLAADDAFDFANAIDENELGGAAGSRKLSSGLSSDERAIFVYDEATNRSAALFRSRPDGPFDDAVDRGARHGLSSNADCSALYSSALVAGVSRLVRQARSD